MMMMGMVMVGVGMIHGWIVVDTGIAAASAVAIAVITMVAAVRMKM